MFSVGRKALFDMSPFIPPLQWPSTRVLVPSSQLWLSFCVCAQKRKNKSKSPCLAVRLSGYDCVTNDGLHHLPIRWCNFFLKMIGNVFIRFCSFFPFKMFFVKFFVGYRFLQMSLMLFNFFVTILIYLVFFCVCVAIAFFLYFGAMFFHLCDCFFSLLESQSCLDLLLA